MEAATLFIIISSIIILVFIVIKSLTTSFPSVLQLMIMIFLLAFGHLVIYTMSSKYYIQIFAISTFILMEILYSGAIIVQAFNMDSPTI